MDLGNVRLGHQGEADGSIGRRQGDEQAAVLRKNSVFVEKTEVKAGGVMVVDWDGGSVDNLIDGLPQVGPVCT